MSVVLSEHLPLLATAPDGIQKLRGLIYELASRGKLTEAASGVSAKSVNLGEVVEFVMGQAPPGSECNTDGVGSIFVKTGEFREEFPVVREWTTKPLKFAKRGDVLICVVGATVGKLNLAIDCAIGRSVAAIRPCDKLDTRYLYAALVPFTLRLRNQSRGSAQGVIGKSELGQVEIRFPPLAEQHRIVAKVDELMALCDRLEAEQTDAGAAHARLVDTLLGTLTQSADAADLAANWQRLAEHFDTLFTTESSLNALKQTILQLAVMGKLVPQDPNDEPANELLERIAKQRVRLEAEGKIKKSKSLPLLSEDERPFTIPKTWNWIRLGALTELITKGSSPKWQGIEYVTQDDGVLFITSENVGNYLLRKLDTLKYVDPRFNDIEPRSILRYGDILINLVGASIGRTARFDLREVANINQAVALVRLINAENIDSTYLLHFLNGDFAINHMLASQVVNAQPNISLTDVRDFPVPLPPLSEQHRIVAKVDELMALVDCLKAGLAESRAQQAQLSDTLIETALAAA